VDEAIARHLKAIELNPNFARAYRSLGIALGRKGQADEAIACFRKAIELDPKLAPAYGNLGLALGRKGGLDEAISCHRKAIELNPKSANDHNSLGVALVRKSQVDEAIACFRKAIGLDPKIASARIQLARAERMASARDKLPAFLNGSYTPASDAERLGLAEWCLIKKLHHAAASLYSAAFVAAPKLADDVNAQHRYDAACCAALAAAGQGEDAAKLDDKERARLRKQALDWLRADLVLRTKQAQVLPRLRDWQRDVDLAGIRDAAALAKLPTEEQKACNKLWADVAELLKIGQEKPK
jgi:tetratricopeptide (TPR) repeat protein